MLRSLHRWLFVLVAVVFLSGCAGAAQPPANPAASTVAPAATQAAATAAASGEAAVEQTFRIALGSDTGPLNPHDYSSSFVALDLVYEPLVRYQADGSFAPALAESWDISSDGLTWTFTLREGVTFHDGEPFNAEAAKWNFERWVQQERHSWLPTTTRIQSVEAPNPTTLVLKMNTFYYAAMNDLALVRPVRFLSPKAVAADGTFATPSGTGPWQLASYTPEQRAELVPYAGYWGEKPTLDKLVFEIIPDPQTRIAALLGGEVDLIGGEYIGGISLESLPVLQRNAGVQVLTAPGTTSYMLQTNFAQPPFNDLRMRQALNHAIDRPAISERLFAGIAAPAQGIFPEGVPYVRHTESDLYTYNPERAKQLLAEAGYTPGTDGMLQKNGTPLALRLVVDGAMFPQAKAMAEVIQAQLNDVGIALTPEVRDYSGWLDAYTRKDFDLLMNISWGAPYDPHSSLSGVFSSRSTGTIAYASPELDALIDAALAERDEAQRQARHNAIWQLLDQEAAAVPLVYSNRVYALRQGIDGFALAGTEYELDLHGVRIMEP